MGVFPVIVQRKIRGKIAFPGFGPRNLHFEPIMPVSGPARHSKPTKMHKNAILGCRQATGDTLSNPNGPTEETLGKAVIFFYICENRRYHENRHFNHFDLPCSLAVHAGL